MDLMVVLVKKEGNNLVNNTCSEPSFCHSREWM